ncbi:MAG: deoxyribodipyrimidine photo-lyase [Propionicimonas sp.]|nr:deoxyribodipyrimidine photo-lyase [Propionicimonas sp.]
MTTNLLWLRRDLRRRDHPALAAAAAGGAEVIPVAVLDPAEWAGAAQLGWRAATLAATAKVYDDRLCLRHGDPAEALLALARETGAAAVHATGETDPGGRHRDAVVARRLRAEGIGWVATGTPHAVDPGSLHTLAGTPYRVFTPFAKAWRARGWPAPAPQPDRLRLVGAPSDAAAVALLDRWRTDCPIELPEAGEPAAVTAWDGFRADRLSGYADTRDRPDLDTTSRLSPHLALGTLHPRTLLADLADAVGAGPGKFVSELAWREFHADLLWHHPGSLAEDLTPALAGLAYDEPDERLAAWRQGRTGYPLVDAGLRQLLAEGWMHNRVRMVAASFLVKDLHLAWQHGARHFREHLIDFDPASNTHNWQWVAGTGADAAPYPRVFNPVTQSEALDPAGEYVRRHLPELAHLAGSAALRPWDRPDGYAHGYPPRIVDHAFERLEALTRQRLAVRR